MPGVPLGDIWGTFMFFFVGKKQVGLDFYVCFFPEGVFGSGFGGEKGSKFLDVCRMEGPKSAAYKRTIFSELICVSNILLLLKISLGLPEVTRCNHFSMLLRVVMLVTFHY